MRTTAWLIVSDHVQEEIEEGSNEERRAHCQRGEDHDYH